MPVGVRKGGEEDEVGRPRGEGWLVVSCLQPVLVVSSLGGGRAGCFCAVGVAHQMMSTPGETPSCWEQTENNILDQVSTR